MIHFKKIFNLVIFVFILTLFLGNFKEEAYADINDGPCNGTASQGVQVLDNLGHAINGASVSINYPGTAHFCTIGGTSYFSNGSCSTGSNGQCQVNNMDCVNCGSFNISASFSNYNCHSTTKTICNATNNGLAQVTCDIPPPPQSGYQGGYQGGYTPGQSGYQGGYSPGQSGYQGGYSGSSSCSVSFTSPTSGSNLNAGGSYTATVTGNSCSGPSCWTNVAWRMDGGGWSTSVTVVSGGSNPRFSFNFTAPSSGSHNLYFGENSGATACSGSTSFSVTAAQSGYQSGYQGGYQSSYDPNSHIRGHVYQDAQHQGSGHNVNTPFGGVLVKLSDQNCTTIASANTASDGSYSFDFSPQIFHLTMVNPAGYQYSWDSQASWLGGACPSFDANGDHGGNYNTSAGQTWTWDWGASPVFSISGSIINDPNICGGPCGGQSAYTGTDGAIYLNGGQVKSPDTSGNYLYTNQFYGNYSISHRVPTGYALTSLNPLAVNNLSANSSGNNFYIAPLGNVTVNVYNDADGNGFQDPGDSGISNVQVYESNVGTLNNTASDGTYIWPAVPNSNGQYIRVTIPSGYAVSTPPVAPGSIQSSAGTTYGYWYHDQYFQNYILNVGLRKNSVSGKVYLDYNKTHKSTGQSNYTGPITIEAHNTGTDALLDSYTCSSGCDGTYKLSNLPVNTQFYVRYTNLPAGYTATYPSGTPLQMIGGVGASCTTSGDSFEPAVCTNGELTNLNFGITDAVPWFQGVSGDMRLDPGFNDPVPNDPVTPNPNPYVSLQGAGGTAGIVFYGNNSSPNTGAAQNSVSPNNWKVGGSSAPNLETFSPVNTGTIRTSYNYVNSTVTQNNIASTNLPNGCYSPPGCDISTLVAASGGNHGVFKGSNVVYLNTSTYSGGNIVMLTSSDVFIDGNIVVSPGSTLTVISQGTIRVAAAATRIDGFYSANVSFDSGGIGSNGSCATPDQQLVINGNLVINAGLSGGSFFSNRNLCNQDLTIPGVKIVERPDFYLNAPDLIRHSVSVWQEVTP